MGDENKNLRTIDKLNSYRKDELENCRRQQNEMFKFKNSGLLVLYENLTANLCEVQKEIVAKKLLQNELTEQYDQQLKRIRELRVLKLIRMDYGIK